MISKVVIVGRPNVGKSSLFNMLTRSYDAMVSDFSGTTRDSRYKNVVLNDKSYLLFDTAGLDNEEQKLKADGKRPEGFADQGFKQNYELQDKMNATVRQALKDSDIILFMIDAKGITQADELWAQEVRRFGKQVILLINKCDLKTAQDTKLDAYSLGLDEPHLISVAHSINVRELEEKLYESIQNDIEAPLENEPMKLAIVGRPNAGKSTLINTFLGEERMLTGDTAGLTRESIATLVKKNGKMIELIDTPGIRKRGKVTEELEKMMVGEALDSINKANLVLLVIDATAPLEKQDITIAVRAERLGKPIVIALNKWDLIEAKDELLEELRYQITKGFHQVKDLPIVPISALSGKNVDKLIPKMDDLYAQSTLRISTGKLNRFLAETLEQTPPPSSNGKLYKIKYITQSGILPPTFNLSVNRKEGFPEAYLRFFAKALRETFGFKNIPIKLYTKTSENPYADKVDKFAGKETYK